MREMIEKRQFKIIIGIIIGIVIIFLFNGFKSEIEMTTVKRRYDAYSFPQYITYKTNRGLIKYRGDLKFNPDSVFKENGIYYAEYSGVMKKVGFSFIK